MSRLQVQDRASLYDAPQPLPVIHYPGHSNMSDLTPAASGSVWNPRTAWPGGETWAWLQRAEGAIASIRGLRVRVPDASDVKAYLLDHPDLAPLMVAMARRATEEFSREAQVSLEMIYDPEGWDAYAALQLRYESYPEDLIERLDAVNAEFTEPRVRASGWFYLTTDYQRVK